MIIDFPVNDDFTSLLYDPTRLRSRLASFGQPHLISTAGLQFGSVSSLIGVVLEFQRLDVELLLFQHGLGRVWSEGYDVVVARTRFSETILLLFFDLGNSCVFQGGMMMTE